MKIVLLGSAQDDLESGAAFYENQGADLGAYFLESLISDIDSLLTYAGIHPRVFGYHRLLAKHFPYAIYYSFDEEAIVVRGVLDCRRDPAWLRRRLRNRN